VRRTEPLWLEAGEPITERVRVLPEVLVLSQAGLEVTTQPWAAPFLVEVTVALEEIVVEVSPTDVVDTVKA